MPEGIQINISNKALIEDIEVNINNAIYKMFTENKELSEELKKAIIDGSVRHYNNNTRMLEDVMKDIFKDSTIKFLDSNDREFKSFCENKKKQYNTYYFDANDKIGLYIQYLVEKEVKEKVDKMIKDMKLSFEETNCRFKTNDKIAPKEGQNNG